MTTSNSNRPNSTEQYFKANRNKLANCSSSRWITAYPNCEELQETFPNKLFFITNRKTGKFDYVSPRLDSLFGFSKASPVEQTIEYIMNKISDPEEFFAVLKIFTAFEAFCQGKTDQEISDLRLIRTYRLKCNKNIFKRVTDKSSVLSMSEHGDILSIITFLELMPLLSEFDLGTGLVINSISGVELASFNTRRDAAEEILSKREIEILKMIAHGERNKEIAEKLFLSKYTVETHRKNIMRKLEISAPIELVWKALEMNLIHSK